MADKTEAQIVNACAESAVYYIECKNQGDRHCLANKGVVHKQGDETAYLECSDGRVWYRCNAKQCAGKRVDIGEIPASASAFFQEMQDSAK